MENIKQRKLSLTDLQWVKKIQSPLFSIIVAFLASAIFVLWAKNESILYYFDALGELIRIMIYESFGTSQKMLELLVYTTPLLFCGLAHIIAFKCGLFNIGVEGQFIMGMIAAGVLGQIKGLASPIHVILIIVAGMVIGGLWGTIPGYLRAKRGTNEVVICIMMNFVAMYMSNFIALRTPINDRSSNATFIIQKTAQLPRFAANSRANISILFALVMVVLVYLLINKSNLGFQIRAIGLNPKAAEMGGINVANTIILAMTISGAIAGLGGLTHVTGVQLKVSSMVSFPGYGMDAITVALLANSNPFACILAALLFGALDASARMFQLNGIPKEIVYVIQSVIIFFIASDLLTKRIGKGGK